MSLYAISDLHLSLGTDKPMDVFGGKWENYTEKLRESWQATVNDNDVVLIPGDISWAMYIEECYNDFSFIESLNGQKLILKGNHDYWWTTMKKLNGYVKANGFTTMRFIHNTAEEYDSAEGLPGAAICGTRGWNLPSGKFTDEDMKIFDREKIRLILSLESAMKLKKEHIIVCMHYPPADNSSPNTDFLDIMKNYGVKTCIYGHLHHASHRRAVTGNVDGIELVLASCDAVDFTPVKIL